MRIYDLLNDEDDAPYQHGSPASSVATVNSPLSAFERSWRDDQSKASTSSPLQGFPSFLLNDAATVVKKTLADRVYINSRNYHGDEDEDDGRDDDNDERKTSEPRSPGTFSPVYSAATATRPMASSMSILDILGSTTKQQLPSLRQVTAMDPGMRSPPAMLRVASNDSGYRSSVSDMAVPAIEPMPRVSEEPVVLERSSSQSSEDKDELKRAKQRVLYRRCYYKKTTTLIQLRATYQALQDKYRYLLDTGESRGNEAMSHNRQEYRELCRRKDELQNEGTLLTKRVMEISKLQDKLQWLVDAEITDQGQSKSTWIEPSIPSACLLYEPLLSSQCRALTNQLSLPTCLSSSPSPSDYLDDEVFGWSRIASATSVGLPPGAFQLMYQKRFASVSISETVAATWRLLLDPRQVGDMIFGGRTSQVTTLQQVDPDHIVLHVERPTWQSVVLCSRINISATSSVMTIQSLNRPTLSGSSSVIADRNLAVDVVGEDEAQRKHWLSSTDLMAWIRLDTNQDDSSATTRPTFDMNVECGLQVQAQRRPASELGDASTNMNNQLERRLQLRLVTAMRRWETALSLANSALL